MDGIDVATIVAADLKHVLEACRRYQRARRQLAFKHGIGGNGGAVMR